MQENQKCWARGNIFLKLYGKREMTVLGNVRKLGKTSVLLPTNVAKLPLKYSSSQAQGS